MWQNSRAERDKSILRRGNIFLRGRRGFFDPLHILTLLFLSVSLLSQLKLLPSAFWYTLPQCFWAFVYLKKETFIYKESIKASSKKDYLKQCSLERTKLSQCSHARTPTYDFQFNTVLCAFRYFPYKACHKQLSALFGLNPQDGPG